MTENWTDITILGSDYECQMDVARNKFRHRYMPISGGKKGEWQKGLAPDMIDTITGTPRFQWVPE